MALPIGTEIRKARIFLIPGRSTPVAGEDGLATTLALR
jgi:hypothetical protein